MEATTHNTNPNCSNCTTLKCKPKKNRLETATDRQERIPWWHQDRMGNARALVVGAGGLGGPVSHQLTQQGVGELNIIDNDRVDITNLSRQFYTARDVGQYKAHALPKRLRPFATGPTIIKGYAAKFEDVNLDEPPDIIVCGVDNDTANVSVAQYAHKHRIPVVFVNVSKDGEACRVFIQTPGAACFACYKPNALTPKPPAPCTPTPAIVDILHVATGLAVRATTTLLMGESIGDYNCRDLTMSGTDLTKTVQRRNECPLCSSVTARRNHGRS